RARGVVSPHGRLVGARLQIDLAHRDADIAMALALDVNLARGRECPCCHLRDDCRERRGIGHCGLRCEDPDLAMWGWFSPAIFEKGVPIPTPVRPGSGSKGFGGRASLSPFRGTPWIGGLSTECRTQVKRRRGIARDSLRTGNFSRSNRDFLNSEFVDREFVAGFAPRRSAS